MDRPLARITDIAKDNDGLLERDVLDQLAYNEKMAELGQLAAGLVHELNTPLSVINSAAQMILREDSLSDFIREMVERISQETQRLSQYSRGLLNFSRKDDMEVGEINLAQVLKEVMAFLRYEAQKRSIVVMEDLDFRLPAVIAETNHLKQIFINLIMNALQAMEEGGTLLIRTSRRDGEFLEVQIADTGPGIPVESVERIFEPFFTTKGSNQGTGLGLFISRKIVELYGGSIRVKSIPKQGTTFFVSFPAAVERQLLATG
jgi:two-component system NtrC family sensor kinase